MFLRFVHPPCSIFWRIIGTRNLELLSFRFLVPNNGTRNGKDCFFTVMLSTFAQCRLREAYRGFILYFVILRPVPLGRVPAKSAGTCSV
jgi:hypothetical protein